MHQMYNNKAYILPATHTGSPRSMFEKYQNAMASVRVFGKPDYFVTFSCNPNWPEITENILPNKQKPCFLVCICILISGSF